MPCPYEITFVFSFENWVCAALLPTYEECPNSFPLRDCVAMHKWPILVISSGARDLAFSATCEEKISRLWLEMTIATQSRCGEEPAPDSIRGRRRGCSSWCKVCILYCPRIPPSLSSRSNFTTSSLGICSVSHLGKRFTANPRMRKT